jgi:hypothetical protein
VSFFLKFEWQRKEIFLKSGPVNGKSNLKHPRFIIGFISWQNKLKPSISILLPGKACFPNDKISCNTFNKILFDNLVSPTGFLDYNIEV